MKIEAWLCFLIFSGVFTVMNYYSWKDIDSSRSNDNFFLFIVSIVFFAIFSLFFRANGHFSSLK